MKHHNAVGSLHNSQDSRIISFFFLAAAAIQAILLLVSCGGGSSGGSPPPPPADFAIQLSTNAVSVIAGDQSSLVISISPQNGFTGSVTLGISGLPQSISGSFTPAAISPGQTSTLVIQASSSASAQSLPFQVTGTVISLSHSKSATLTVLPVPQGPSSRSTYIEVEGALHELVYDPIHKLVFAANPELNQVEVISTTTLQRLTPLPIPQPWTIDITPDASLLWVGQSSDSGMGEFLEAVDLSTMQVVQRVTPPRLGQSPLTNIRALAATSNGSLLLRVGPVGSSIEGLLQFKPSTGTFLDRTKEVGSCRRFHRSDDGSKVLLGVFGGTILYDAVSDTFIENSTVGSPLEAIRPDGKQIATLSTSGDLVFLDGQLNEITHVSRFGIAGNPVYSRDGRFLYVPQNISIIRSVPSVTVVDATTFAIVGQIPDLFLTNDSPPYCDAIDVCDSTPGGTTLRTSEDSGLLIGPSPGGLSFLDTSQPSALLSVQPAFNLYRPFTATPSQGDGTSDLQVTLNGSNFVSGGLIAFGPKAAAIVNLLSNQIQVVSPSSSVSGPVNVLGEFPNGWTTLAPMAFSYGPQIRYVVPSGDAPSGGGKVSIVGYGFGMDGSKISVTIGGKVAKLTNPPDYAQNPHTPMYLITVSSPPGSASPADVTISTANGQATMLGAFHYWQAVQDFPIQGNFAQILFDHFRNLVYMLDSAANRIQVFSVSSHQFLPALATGNAPQFMTLLPDGSLLCVANSADNTVSLIDPANPANSRVVNVTIPTNASFQPVQLAATSTHKLLINYRIPATISSGLELLDLNALTLSQPPIQPCLDCVIEGSADGRKVFFEEVEISSGTVSIYDSATNTFTLTRQLQNYLGEMAVAPDANRWIVDYNILDSTDTLESSISISPLIVANSPNAVLGRRIQSSGGLMYLPLVNGLHIYDLPHGRLLRSYGGLSLTTSAVHTIAIDEFGATVYAISTDGLEIAALDSVPLGLGHVVPAAGPPGTLIALRGSGFTSSTQVKIGGQSVSPQFVDGNTLQVVVPALPSGSVRITVSNDSGEGFALDAGFTVN